MGKNEKIMGLVEEVRDILNLHTEKLHHAKKKALVKKFGQKTPHNPFKNIKKGKHLGGTSKTVAVRRGPSTKNPGTARGVWRCRCRSYDCHCVGKTKEGKTVEKHVAIDRNYKAGYNSRYKSWRSKHKNRYAPGGKAGFRAPAKPHHKRYHAD